MSNKTIVPARIRNGAPLGMRAQGGFTLIELLVSTTVAIFLLGGLFASLQSTRSAFRNQGVLAELQDNQRLAMNLMADVIESAGYYPDPKNNDGGTVLPAGGVFANADQAVFGTHSAAAPGDTVTIRYGAGLLGGVSDNVFNCAAQQNTTVAGYDVFVNKFYVAPAAGDPTTQALWCTATTAAGNKDVQLVNGVQNLQVWYGVQETRPSTTGTCTETYLRADQMQPADWAYVCTIRVSLTFTNKMQANNSSVTAPPITISRVITIMNAAGVNT
jgi:type IV pilus assembly protein PilW